MVRTPTDQLSCPRPEDEPERPYKLGKRLATLVFLALSVGIPTGYTVAQCHTDAPEKPSARTLVIPPADRRAGELPGDVTIAAVCDTTTELIENAELPPGVSQEEKRELQDSCKDLAVGIIDLAPDNDATGSEYSIGLVQDFMGRYAVTAEKVPES